MRGETETISLVASPTQTVAEDLGEDGIIDLTRALSSTAAPSRTLTPALEDPACLRRPVDLELSSTPAFSATLDAETPRPQSPIPKQKPSSDAQAESSMTAQPATPPRNSDAANGSRSQTPLIPASRKRRAEEDVDDEPVAVKKEEENSRSNEISLTPHHNRAGRAIKFEIEVDEDGDNSSDDDVIEISPFKRLKGRQDIRSYFETGPFRRRQRSESPSPLPPPEPFYHPDFPERPPLRCPNRNQDHTLRAGVVCEAARTNRNMGREYYRCAACPGFGGFICWADGRGIRPDNPRCDCGYAAREDITGGSSKQPDTLWYKCATNACGFRRYDWDDPLAPEEVNARCGREVYRL